MTRDHARLIGQQVESYILTDAISSGTAGIIYHAIDLASRRPKSFAVKCLPKTEISERQRYQTAGEIINHDTVTGCPHVLPLFDIVEEELFYFLVLDLYKTDMFKAIWYKKVYWRNDALIRQAFVEIVDGVIACHQKSVFHRDLKPENIMCKADGTGVQISGFGFSTHRSVCLDGGGGTPSYMSPECWTSGEGVPYYGGPTDVWSLGVILFCMVTNRHPWAVAHPSNKEFKAFLDDEDYLFHTSPISVELNVLLKWILYPLPGKRLSLPEIRKAVLDINTFYRGPATMAPRAKRQSIIGIFHIAKESLLKGYPISSKK